MRGELIECIGKIGVFLICTQVLVHFRPRESYEKYLRLLASTMILLQFLVPIGKKLNRVEKAGGQWESVPDKVSVLEGEMWNAGEFRADEMRLSQIREELAQKAQRQYREEQEKNEALSGDEKEGREQKEVGESAIRIPAVEQVGKVQIGQ